MRTDRDGAAEQAGDGSGVGKKNVFIRMVECHAGLEIAPYISSAMRRETLFSTSQKPRTDVDRWRGGDHPRTTVSLDFLIRTKLDVHTHTISRSLFFHPRPRYPSAAPPRVLRSQQQ